MVIVIIIGPLLVAFSLFQDGLVFSLAHVTIFCRDQIYENQLLGAGQGTIHTTSLVLSRPIPLSQ